MKEKKDNSDIFFNSNIPPAGNRPRRGPYPPRGPVPRGRGPVRGPAPKKKFIDDNLFIDPKLNKPKKEKEPFDNNKLVIIIAIVIGVLALGGLIYYFVTKEKPAEGPKKVQNKNIFVGSWNCKDWLTEDGRNYYPGDKYIISIAFDNNGKFIFGSYNDLDKNYSVGNYQYEFVQKSDDNLEIYNLGLFANKAVKNGYIEIGNYESIYKAGISSKDGQMLLDNQKKESMYICSSHDRTNPKIEQ